MTEMREAVARAMREAEMYVGEWAFCDEDTRIVYRALADAAIAAARPMLMEEAAKVAGAAGVIGMAQPSYWRGRNDAAAAIRAMKDKQI
jgi:hypothetical protein